jgi:hypothetical protein
LRARCLLSGGAALGDLCRRGGDAPHRGVDALGGDGGLALDQHAARRVVVALGLLEGPQRGGLLLALAALGVDQHAGQEQQVPHVLEQLRRGAQGLLELGEPVVELLTKRSCRSCSR